MVKFIVLKDLQTHTQTVTMITIITVIEIEKMVLSILVMKTKL